MINKILQLTIAAILAVPAFAGAATIQLPATGQITCFDAAGNVVTCVGSGQDGEKQAGVAWPSPRFTDNANGTVTDNLTGLMWSKHANAPDLALGAPCPNAEADMFWQQALDFIACLNTSSYLGFTDWRLPNLNELESMVTASVPDSSVYLNANGFGNANINKQVQSSDYWTSTTDDGDMLSSWDVAFNTNDFPLSTVKISGNLGQTGRGVWPVRGASTGPAQLWQTGQTVCANDAGVSRPCAGTGEDGDKLAGAAWPVPRFASNAGGTFAADRLTGLIWPTNTQSAGPANCPNTGALLSWQNALAHVQCLNDNAYLGITDWRLPNRKELRSLVDYSQSAPALPLDNPFNAGVGEPFWSSTTDATQTQRAWTISLVNGSLNGVVKTTALHVLAVSGPDAVAPANFAVNPVTTPSRAAITVSGTVEAGATVQVAVNNGAPAAATVTGTNWSASISGMPAGANSIAATAIDLAGNPTTITAAVTVILPDGSFSGTGAVSVVDALKALRISVQLVTPTAEDRLHGDVTGPQGVPDDAIDINDALMILKKAVGLVSF